MRPVKLFLVSMVVLLLCFSLEGTVKSKRRRGLQKKKLNTSSDQEAYQVITDYCKVKHASVRVRVRHSSRKFERCMNNTMESWKNVCLTKTARQCKQKLKQMKSKMSSTFRKAVVMGDSRRKEMRSHGRNGSAVCMLTNKGLTVYDINTSICCNGTLLRLPLPDEECCHGNYSRSCCLGCCGGVVYRRTEGYCVYGRIFGNGSSPSLVAQTTSSVASRRPLFQSEPISNEEELNEKVEDLSDPTRPIELGIHVPMIVFIASTSILVLILVLVFVTVSVTICDKNYLQRNKGTKARGISQELHLETYPKNSQASENEQAEPRCLSRLETEAALTPSCCREESLYDGDSICSMIMVSISDFSKPYGKDSHIPSDNDYSNLMKCVQTQTPPPKETNLRDSLGRPFQGDFLATKTDRVIQLPHSDVVMTLPEKDLQEEPIQCHVSSISDLREMRRKLKLADDQHIVSPMAEYTLRGIGKLQDHAVIKMPVCGLSDSLQAIRVISDQGAGEVFEEVFDIPMVRSRQEGLNLDTFAILSQKKPLVLIFTRVFSVYLILDSKKREFEAKAATFIGVQQTGKPSAKVTVRTYITGGLSSMKDYFSQTEIDEKELGRRLIDKKSLDFQKDVRREDTLKIYMNINDSENWDFVKDPQEPNNTKKTHNVPVWKIVRESGDFINHMVYWDVESQKDSIPRNFGCHLHIDHLDGRHEPMRIFDHSIDKSTKRGESRSMRQRDSVGTFSSNSQYSMVSEYSGEMQTTVAEIPQSAERVRKELDNTTLPSLIYTGKRPEHFPSPMPELSKLPEGSFAQRNQSEAHS